MSPDSRAQTAELRSRFDQALAIFLDRQRDRLVGIDDALLPVAAALREFVLGGGKRLRPAFGYWGYRGAGGADRDEVVSCLASLELLHACALIHDDLMDSSDTRRGRPAIHRRFAELHGGRRWEGDPIEFGSSAAILLGDLCLGWSIEMYTASGLPPEQLAAAHRVYDQMRTEVMSGQYLDMLAQADTGWLSAARAGKVARYKSAKYTVERPLLLGGRLAGAGPEVLAACSRYGLPLGEAFQLRDDVLGVFGDPSTTGKPAGDDLREGKRTYLVAVTWEAAGEIGRKLLDNRLGDPDLDASGVAELRALITETGALARTEQRIAELTGTALAALDAAPLEPAALAALHDLADAATVRVD